MVKCTEEEKAFLFKRFGEDKVKDLPWRDDHSANTVNDLIEDAIFFEGMTPDLNFLNDLGVKYQFIYDSLCFQNSAYCAILTILEKSKGDKNFDPQSISPETLGKTKKECDSALRRMVEYGDIEGLSIPSDPDGEIRDLEKTVITPKGIDYLHGVYSELVQKAAEYAKEIVDGDLQNTEEGKYTPSKWPEIE